jgi:hypothetical protein
MSLFKLNASETTGPHNHSCYCGFSWPAFGKNTCHPQLETLHCSQRGPVEGYGAADQRPI